MTITRPEQLPEPECELGYPHSQLEEMFDEQQMKRLHLWMAGQTQAICEGKLYDHGKGEYYPCCDGTAHGYVMYAHDVRRWLSAGPILD